MGHDCTRYIHILRRDEEDKLGRALNFKVNGRRGRPTKNGEGWLKRKLGKLA